MKNSMAPVLLILILLSASFSCSRTNDEKKTEQRAVAADQDSLHSILLAKTKQYYTDMSSRDWEAYASHFWPGAQLTTIWQPPGSDSLQVMMTTVEAFVKQADQGPGSQPIFEEKMLDAKVMAYNNLATVWATYRAKFGSKDSLMQWEGIDAFTFMKHENQWRISSLAYTNKEE